MNWQLLILISVVLASITSIIQRIIMKDKRNDPVTISVMLQIFGGLMIFILGLFQSVNYIDQDYGKVFWNILLMVAMYSTGSVSLFKAFQYMDPSRFSIIFSVKVIFTLIFSTLFLNESLTGVRLLGLVLIMLSVLLINYEKGTFKLAKGDIYVLYTAFAFGTGTTNDRYILSFIDPYPYMVLGFILPGIVNILIFRKSIKGIGHIINVKFLGSFLVYVFIYVLGSITFYLAMGTTDNSSQLASLSLLQGILTVILSIIIFKEKDKILIKLLAGIISLIGLLILV